MLYLFKKVIQLSHICSGSLAEDNEKWRGHGGTVCASPSNLSLFNYGCNVKHVCIPLALRKNKVLVQSSEDKFLS